MSSISGLTAQANGIAGCSPQDCCNQIAALSARVSALEGHNLPNRVTALENRPNRDHSADIARLSFRLDGAQSDFIEGMLLLRAAIEAVKITAEIAKALAEAAVSGLSQLGGQLRSLADGLGGFFNRLGIADGAYELAQAAMTLAGRASDQAATGILRANAAQTSADAAAAVANIARAAASAAQSTANYASGQAERAQGTADRAIGAATNADRKAGRAQSTAETAQRTADLAGIEASAAFGLANRASDRADDAQRRADRAQDTADDANAAAAEASSTAGAANNKADRAISSAGTANTKADRAITSAGAANTKADRAIVIASSIAARPGVAGRDGRDGAQGIPGSVGARGRDGAIGLAGRDGFNGSVGSPGVPGRDGRNGAPGAQGIPGVAGANGRDGATGAQGIPGITTTINQNTVNPGKEDEIIRLLSGTRADVLALPATLVASQSYRAAAISAAAVGSCQSSQPGKCPGGSSDQNRDLGGLMNGLSAGIGLLNNQILLPMSNVVNTINTKLGAPVIGGLSKWVTNIADLANKSQVLNVLNYIATLHNAYFLSNALSQTLFSAIGNSLAALGLKDTSQDPAGQPLNIGKVVGDYTEAFFKTVFGVATVNGIKADWKKYSRIYQAAAQVLSSLQSIGHSILGAIEVVGSHVAKIGNALQKFRVVSEKAYAWMNPTPSFQNRFLTGLQTAQTVVSQVDQVASETLSIQQQVTEIQKNSTELQKTLKQEPNSAQATPTPEAVKVKEAAAEVKIASKSPPIPETAIPKPD